MLEPQLFGYFRDRLAYWEKETLLQCKDTSPETKQQIEILFNTLRGEASVLEQNILSVISGKGCF